MTDTKTGREKIVVHNNLARHVIESRMASLTVADQRVIAYLLAKGVPTDARSWDGRIVGEVAELAQMCGLTANGSIYAAVERSLESLLSHKIKFRDLHDKDGKEVWVACNWISYGKYWRNEGRYEVEIPAPLRPMLVNLRSQRTEADLQTFLQLRGGAYAYRLYLVAKSHASQRGWVETIEALRQQLGVPDEAYKLSADFRRFALDRPLAAINGKSDLVVTYEKANPGRKWIKIRFSVKIVEKAVEKMAKAKLVSHLMERLPSDEQADAWTWLQTRDKSLPARIDWRKVDQAEVHYDWQMEKSRRKFEHSQSKFDFVADESEKAEMENPFD